MAECAGGEDARADCRASGELRESAAGPGLFDFRIEQQLDTGKTITCTGRAWLQPSGHAGRPELIMVGDDAAQRAFGMLLQRS